MRILIMSDSLLPVTVCVTVNSMKCDITVMMLNGGWGHGSSKPKNILLPPSELYGNTQMGSSFTFF